MGRTRRSRSRKRREMMMMSEYQFEHTGVHSKRITYASMGALILICPPLVICLWYTMVHLDGSLERIFKYLRDYKFIGIRMIWPMPTPLACKLIVSFAAFEILLQLFLPGDKHFGPVSPAGNLPVYKKNGFASYMVTLFVYYFLYKEKYFNLAIVYDHLGEIFSTLIIGSFIVCLCLYMKGHTAPSSSDWGSTGNIVVDFYWGMELYPKIGTFDIKVFTNCRFGMMGWAILVISYCIKQKMIIDGGRGGFLQMHKCCDFMYFRPRWALARHFHYAPEIGAAFFWSVPALFEHVLPYFYTIFLTILLVDRANRDDRRCKLKYGKYWDHYRKKVPWKILPRVF